MPDFGSVFAPLNRRTIRAPVNEMDKCTVVSIYPEQITVISPTTQPSTFIVPSGNYDKPGILVVGPVSWWKELEENQPLLEITNSSIQVADSIVKDWANTLIEFNGDSCMPGVFYLQGVVSLIDLKKPENKLRLDKANVAQKTWFSALVRSADSLWARSGGNPLAIPRLSKMAAQELGLDKEWTKDVQLIESVKCQACGTLKNPAFPVCPACKAIDMTHPNAAKIKFAV